jgi:hypothetical protein
MRYDGDATAPKCPSDEVLVRASWPFPETIDSPILPNPVPAAGMVVLKLFWVTSFHGLSRGEIPPLGNGEFVEPSSRVLRISFRHGSNKVT